MNEKSKEYYSKLLYSRSIENPHRYQDLSQNYYSFVASFNARLVFSHPSFNK